MQRRIYIKFESRDNMGYPDKVVERLAVFDDNDSQDELADTLEKWAAETGRTMATILTVTKADARKYLRDNHVQTVIEPSEKELAERDRVRSLFNGRKNTG